MCVFSYVFCVAGRLFLMPLDILTLPAIETSFAFMRFVNQRGVYF